MEHQRTVLRTSLTFFHILGLHPYKKIVKIKVVSFITILLTLFGLVILRVRYEKLTFGLLSDTFESAYTIIHVLAKYVTLAIANPTYRNILETTSTFWYFKFNPKFEQELIKSLKILHYLLRTFLCFIILTIVSFGIRPVFNDSLAISCYIPEFIPRPVFSVFNSVIFGFCAFAVGSFDMFVCTMIVLTTVQFRILNYAFSSLKLKDVDGKFEEIVYLKKMKMCVDHHNFLDSFLHNVSSVMSPAMLVYLTLAPITLCFELYFTSKSTNLAEIVKSCIYIAGIAIEMFFFFCLPATYLMIESEKMINVMYNSSGWEHCYSPSIRKTIIIMMQRMQKETTLKAGKMVKINLRTCTNAFQMALSFYTSLQILDDKTKQKWG